jgi:hypothetical protein
VRDKRRKFVNIAEKRVNRLIKDVRLVGNLSNRSNYQFTDDDVRKIFTAVEAEIRSARRRFESVGSTDTSNFKL